MHIAHQGDGERAVELVLSPIFSLREVAVGLPEGLAKQSRLHLVVSFYLLGFVVTRRVGRMLRRLVL